MIHKTRRGALLAQLEHRCVHPGFWIIEGRMLIKGTGPEPWRLESKTSETWHRRFVDALEKIAEQVT